MRAPVAPGPPGARHPRARDSWEQEIGLPDAPDLEERGDRGSGSNPIRIFHRPGSGQVCGVDSHNGESGLMFTIVVSK